MLPISFAKVTFTARQVFEVYFTISAVRRSTTWILQFSPSLSAVRNWPVA